MRDNTLYDMERITSSKAYRLVLQTLNPLRGNNERSQTTTVPTGNNH